MQEIFIYCSNEIDIKRLKKQKNRAI